jgi:hypothetical protein
VDPRRGQQVRGSDDAEGLFVSRVPSPEHRGADHRGAAHPRRVEDGQAAASQRRRGAQQAAVPPEHRHAPRLAAARLATKERLARVGVGRCLCPQACRERHAPPVLRDGRSGRPVQREPPARRALPQRHRHEGSAQSVLRIRHHRARPADGSCGLGHRPLLQHPTPVQGRRRDSESQRQRQRRGRSAAPCACPRDRAREGGRDPHEARRTPGGAAPPDRHRSCRRSDPQSHRQPHDRWQGRPDHPRPRR